LKLLFILDDTSFYHPQFLGDLIKKLENDTIHVGLVQKIPRKSNLSLYLLRSLYLLKPNEALKLFYESVKNKVKSFFPHKNKFYSIKSVIKYYDLEYFYINKSINKTEYINKIKDIKPDVIISSNSLYFGKKLLSIPNKCCINRHSSLLPSYGGLWPVFQAIRSGENEVGVTIHMMTNDIDKGLILSQGKIPVRGNDTVSKIYEKCFFISVDLVIEALNKIRNDNYIGLDNNFKESYFSFPKKSHWSDLRKLKIKFI